MMPANRPDRVFSARVNWIIQRLVIRPMMGSLDIERIASMHKMMPEMGSIAYVYRTR